VTRPQPQVSVFPDDALGDHGVALAALVRSGERSPAELVEAAIARIEAVDSWPACRCHPPNGLRIHVLEAGHKNRASRWRLSSASFQVGAAGLSVHGCEYAIATDEPFRRAEHGFGKELFGDAEGRFPS
jgi:hypothetical protein